MAGSELDASGQASCAAHWRAPSPPRCSKAEGGHMSKEVWEPADRALSGEGRAQEVLPAAARLQPHCVGLC